MLSVSWSLYGPSVSKFSAPGAVAAALHRGCRSVRGVSLNRLACHRFLPRAARDRPPAPPMVELGPGHKALCHLPREVFDSMQPVIRVADPAA